MSGGDSGVGCVEYACCVCVSAGARDMGCICGWKCWDLYGDVCAEGGIKRLYRNISW